MGNMFPRQSLWGEIFNWKYLIFLNYVLPPTLSSEDNEPRGSQLVYIKDLVYGFHLCLKMEP